MNYNKIKNQKAQLVAGLGNDYKDQYIRGYDKTFNQEAADGGFSRTKAWKSILNIFPLGLLAPLIGWAVPKYADTPPDYFKSEALKNAERNAHKDGAIAAYKYGVKNGLEAEQLATLAKHASEAEYIANNSQESHISTLAVLAVILVVAAVSIFTPIGAVGGILAVAAAMTAPLAGFLYDTARNDQILQEAQIIGNFAEQEAKDGKILPFASKELKEAKAAGKHQDKNISSIKPEIVANVQKTDVVAHKNNDNVLGAHTATLVNERLQQSGPQLGS